LFKHYIDVIIQKKITSRSNHNPFSQLGSGIRSCKQAFNERTKIESQKKSTSIVWGEQNRKAISSSRGNTQNAGVTSL